MSSEVGQDGLQTRHDDLNERLMLLSDNPELAEDMRELAGAWADRLQRSRERFLAPLKVAFIAQVGRGKSALIAAATGLRLPGAGSPRAWSVLPVGDGRTTLGETRIAFVERDDILLRIEPISAKELRIELQLFARDLWDATQERGGKSQAGGPVGEELYDLLRAWMAPGEDDPRAFLAEMARDAADADELRATLLARVDLEQRCMPHERAFAGDEAGLRALREVLADLMGGELPGAPAPKVVLLEMPTRPLGQVGATIVDTRGIDADGSLIQGRSDLHELLTDRNALLVLCTEFESAPDVVTRSVLDAIGKLPGHAMNGRPVRMVIVDRRELAVGERAQQKYERARDERIAQCQDRLRRRDDANREVPVAAIDARREADQIRQLIVDMVTEAREHRHKAWEGACNDAERAIASLHEVEFAATARALDLRLWWAWDAALVGFDPMREDGMLGLAEDLQQIQREYYHSPQLHAAIRRRGNYRELNLASVGAEWAYEAVGMSHLQASVDVGDTVDRVWDRVDDETRRHLSIRALQFEDAAIGYAIELEDVWRSKFEEYFESSRSDELWRWCERRWGQGPGYVADVIARFRKEAKRAGLRLSPAELPAPPERNLPARPPLFSLRRIELENFRGVASDAIELGDRTTVLIGDNGLGKTCWLEAIAAAVGALLPGMGAGPAPTLTASDIRQLVSQLGGVPDRQHQLPMTISAQASVQGHAITWSRRIDTLAGETEATDDDALRVMARQIGQEVRDHAVRQLPVLAYYGTQRLWPTDLRADTERREVGNRLDGYRDCLQAASTHEHLQQWMRKFTYVQVQRQEPVVQLRAIERAVVTCVREAVGFGYDLALEELQLTLDSGEILPFGTLSDGYRNIVAMVADIAWRASVLNPHLQDRAPALAEGVVLIDEIDLHLHPRWQRRVLDDLRRAFPRLQFVATTHSPFIIQSLEPGQLVNLDRSADRDAPYADESPEDIAERIMGVKVPQRSWRRQRANEVATRYYELLERVPDADEAELAQLKAELDALLAPYADNQALVAFLERKRAIAEASRS